MRTVTQEQATTEPGNLVEIYDRLRNLYLRVLYLKRTGVVNITLTN